MELRFQNIFFFTLIIPLQAHLFHDTKSPDVGTYNIQQLLELYIAPLKGPLSYIPGQTDVSDECHNASRLYLDKLEDDMTILRPEDRWVYKMFDASAKIPKTGLMQGRRAFPGNFDSCLEVEATNQNFRGKHCMIQGIAYGGFATEDTQTRIPTLKEMQQYTHGKFYCNGLFHHLHCTWFQNILEVSDMETLQDQLSFWELVVHYKI